MCVLYFGVARLHLRRFPPPPASREGTTGRHRDGRHGVPMPGDGGWATGRGSCSPATPRHALPRAPPAAPVRLFFCRRVSRRCPTTLREIELRASKGRDLRVREGDAERRGRGIRVRVSSCGLMSDSIILLRAERTRQTARETIGREDSDMIYKTFPPLPRPSADRRPQSVMQPFFFHCFALAAHPAVTRCHCDRQHPHHPATPLRPLPRLPAPAPTLPSSVPCPLPFAVSYSPCAE